MCPRGNARRCRSVEGRDLGHSLGFPGDSPPGRDPQTPQPPHPAIAIPHLRIRTPIPRPCWGPAPNRQTSKTRCSSEPHLSARGSSKGLARLLPTAGLNWFGQGAASAGFIPGLRRKALPRPFQGLGSLGKTSVSRALGLVAATRHLAG